MKRILAVVALMGSVLAASAAFAHSPPAEESQRPCKPYRPGVLSANPIVEANKDSEGHEYIGTCTNAGVVRFGTTPDGAFVTADGSKGADVAPSGAPEESHWTKGYVLVTSDGSGTHVYCAGGGQYEDGDQPDDEAVTGDCGNAGDAPSPEPIPTDLPSIDPTATP